MFCCDSIDEATSYKSTSPIEHRWEERCFFLQSVLVYFVLQGFCSCLFPLSLINYCLFVFHCRLMSFRVCLVSMVSFSGNLFVSHMVSIIVFSFLCGFHPLSILVCFVCMVTGTFSSQFLFVWPSSKEELTLPWLWAYLFILTAKRWFLNENSRVSCSHG